MFTLRQKTAILALVLVAALPSVSRADTICAQPIYAQNNTGRAIWVAAEYVPAGSNSFVTDGWWEVGPGRCLRILYNNGRNIYFSARDDQGDTWEGDDTVAQVRGEAVKMFHADTGPCYDPWTINFNPKS